MPTTRFPWSQLLLFDLCYHLTESEKLTYGLKTFDESQLNVLAAEVQRILKPKGKFAFVEVSKPRNKILLFLYSFYLGKIIPVLGKLFLGNPDDYKMLWIYTKQFENAEKVKQIFQNHGLSVCLDQYFWGCASGISGEKTEVPL